MSLVPVARIQTCDKDMREITNPTDKDPEDPVSTLTVGPSIRHLSFDVGGRLRIPRIGS